MRTKGIVLAIAVIVVCNGIALIGVALNRKGGPVQTIELTERELPLITQQADDSGIVLRLNWMAHRWYYDAPVLAAATLPFDEKKLRELGFDCPKPPSDPADTSFVLPKALYLALEYEGQAWKEWQALRADPQNRPLFPVPPGEGENDGTRLFVVDASGNFAELHAKYPDARRHLIVRGVLRATLRASGKRPGQVETREWRGYVTEILPGTINVPLPLASPLQALGKNPGPAPRYAVTLAYGRRCEPWVASVRLLGK